MLTWMTLAELGCGIVGLRSQLAGDHVVGERSVVGVFDSLVHHFLAHHFGGSVVIVTHDAEKDQCQVIHTHTMLTIVSQRLHILINFIS